MKFRLYIDEAGRGPFAGPLHIGIILLLSNFDKTEFNDSKKFTEKQRDNLYEKILKLENQKKLLYGVGSVDNKQIDQLGLTKSLNIAICKGIFDIFRKYINYINIKNLSGEQIINYYKIKNLLNKNNIFHSDIKELLELINIISKFDGIFLDGNKDFGLSKDLGIKIKTIIGGDGKVPEIGMASIIAKVSRDHEMIKLSKKYPKYGFEKHKGYGTKLHRENIIKYGISPIHRTIFLKNLIENNKLKVPNKINSTIKTNQPIIKQNSVIIKKPKLLLHVCCAPDLTFPIKTLKEVFKLYLYRYNPNIHPFEEHTKRYNEYIKLLGLEKGDFEKIEEKYNPTDFFDGIYEEKEYLGFKNTKKDQFLNKISQQSEGGERCGICYKIRLAKAAEVASQNNIEYFTTTLSISPKKNLEKIKNYGNITNQIYPKTNFLFIDFRKNNGYKISCQITKDYGLYRQDYCGCSWSKNRN